MSIGGTYTVTASLGSTTKQGTVKLVEHDSSVLIELDAPVVGKIKARGSIEDDGSFSATGTVRVLLKRISYTLAGRVKGDMLTAVCETNMGTAEITGNRIKY